MHCSVIEHGMSLSFQTAIQKNEAKLSSFELTVWKQMASYTPLAKLLARQADRAQCKMEVESWKLFIHISNKSASIKTKDVPIKSSKLLCFDFILFYSKSYKLKTFPAVISRVFIFIMNGPSRKALDVKWSHLWLMLAISNTFCNWVIVKSHCFLWWMKKKDQASTTRTKPWNSQQDARRL